MKIEFWLEGRVIPKARPRFDGTRVLTQKNYREWKQEAIANIMSHHFPTVEVPCALSVIAVGFKQGDADNLIGSVQDALVQAGVLQDDSLRWLPKISLEYQEGAKGVKGAWVEIVPHSVQKFAGIAPVAKVKSAVGAYSVTSLKDWRKSATTRAKGGTLVKYPPR